MKNLVYALSRLVGKSRVYSWNSRSPFVEPIRTLLAKRLKLTPVDFSQPRRVEEIKSYYRQRRRPRRKGKPLANQ